jgi:hypothetical protein
MRPVNEAARREWLLALRRFKYGFRVRAKLGVLDPFRQQVVQQRLHDGCWFMPQWHDDKWLTLLYTCIRQQEYPEELLLGFVKTAEIEFFTLDQPPTVEKTVAAVDRICKQLNYRLREKFGVFN